VGFRDAKVLDRKVVNRLPDLIREKEAVLGRRLLQKEIARATGIPEGTLSRYVNDHINRFDRHIIVRLCEYFDVELHELITLEPNDSVHRS
jgi:transcriptional regulator with XRE-family HTH domain